MTLLAQAKQGIISREMERVAAEERVAEVFLLKKIRQGRAVILKSRLHDCRPVGIGKGLTVKINANIGTSGLACDVGLEIKKLQASVQYGADAVMDLSTGGDIDAMRRTVLENSTIPVGTVPVYQVLTEGDIAGITEDDFMHGVHRHIEDGVDFITIHSGITHQALRHLDQRIMGIVSRGGSFIAKWMLYHRRENPFLSRFDDIIAMAAKEDVVLSLGDGLRPGCLHDATDKAQLLELKKLGELAGRAYEKDVQVMIEGPGHVPLHQIKKNMKLQKKYCQGAPFYVLGPLVTDVSPGYDHITGAIGGALAAYHGADFLCYLTPREHLGLPDLGDVIEGVIASKIAAHAADIAKGVAGARHRDDEMSRARRSLDWEKMFSLAMNPEKARELHGNADTSECTMCGKLCSVKANNDCVAMLGKKQS